MKRLLIPPIVLILLVLAGCQPVLDAQQAAVNESVVHRFLEEIWNEGNIDVADEIASADLIDHHIPPEMPHGPEALKQWYQLVQAAVPDVQIEVENLVADADQVAVHMLVTGTHEGEFMGLPPTGNSISVNSIAIIRLEDGKMVEIWEVGDSLTLMQQLGAIPTP